MSIRNMIRPISLTAATIILIFLTACAAPQTHVPASLNPTGVVELDRLIEVVLRGDADEVRSLLEFTQAQCTHIEGFGGPPKCRQGEAEGTLVEAMPFIGPEGGFIRREEIGDWQGLQVNELFAAYEASDSVFSDELYPRGEYALVFIDENSSITLQVTHGRIVRIDYGFEYPPQIPAESVVRYLVEPVNSIP